MATDHSYTTYLVVRASGKVQIIKAWLRADGAFHAAHHLDNDRIVKYYRLDDMMNVL